MQNEDLFGWFVLKKWRFPNFCFAVKKIIIQRFLGTENSAEEFMVWKSMPFRLSRRTGKVNTFNAGLEKYIFSIANWFRIRKIILKLSLKIFRIFSKKTFFSKMSISGASFFTSLNLSAKDAIFKPLCYIDKKYNSSL